MTPSRSNNSRECRILVQHRTKSEYNDFIGHFYHFPKKYLGFLSCPSAEFLYFEPTTKGGKGSYFGYGRLGKVFSDKREADHFFVEIQDYSQLSVEVDAFSEGQQRWESGPEYNAQNAVRRVAPDILDQICFSGGLEVSFQADAHLVAILGEQLITSEVVGILELVKNAYDAGATECRVRIEGVPGLDIPEDLEREFPGLPGPVVIVEDNGYGMDRDTIVNGWMRPASTLKTKTKELLKAERAKALASGTIGTYDSLVKELKKANHGRIPLGEKGVGRFAAHRLGRNLNLTTKPVGKLFEYVIPVDWQRFDTPGEQRDLSAIRLTLQSQAPSRDYGLTTTGTRLVIFGGRDGLQLTEETIREIRRTLRNLRSPRLAPEDFDVHFECPQVKDEELPVENLFAPALHCQAQVDENGIAEYTWKIEPPRSVPLSPTSETHTLDLRSTNLALWRSDSQDGSAREPLCGPFSLEVKLWYRNKPWMDGPEGTRFKSHLDRFGGISVFRDGLCVFPARWGSEHDWLGLGKEHIKKGWRFSYYNMLGALDVSQSTNLGLVDKTDREGLVDNGAYRDLVLLAQELLDQFLTPYRSHRDKVHELLEPGVTRDPEILKQVTRISSSLLGRIVRRYDVVEDSLGILDQLGEPEGRSERLLNLSASLKAMEKSVKSMDEVRDMLSEQAGFGLAISVAVHEVAKLTTQFYSGVTALLRSKKYGSDSLLEELRETSSSLRQELKRIGPMRAIRSEKRDLFGVRGVVRFTKEVYQARLEKLGIDLRVTSGDFQVYARRGALNQVFSNLLDNATYWLGMIPAAERRIEIHMGSEDERLIKVCDSGPGIHSSIEPYLFDPGYSMKVPPSGLGLYICRHYMRSMKGDIYQAASRDRVPDFPGAQFILDFTDVVWEEPR